MFRPEGVEVAEVYSSDYSWREKMTPRLKREAKSRGVGEYGEAAAYLSKMHCLLMIMPGAESR